MRNKVIKTKLKLTYLVIGVPSIYNVNELCRDILILIMTGTINFKGG